VEIKHINGLVFFSSLLSSLFSYFLYLISSHLLNRHNIQSITNLKVTAKTLHQLEIDDCDVRGVIVTTHPNPDEHIEGEKYHFVSRFVFHVKHNRMRRVKVIYVGTSLHGMVLMKILSPDQLIQFLVFIGVRS
jgi:hypothetical protein